MQDKKSLYLGFALRDHNKKNKTKKSAFCGSFYGYQLEFSKAKIGVLLWVCSWFVRVSFESRSEKYPFLRTNHEQTQNLSKTRP